MIIKPKNRETKNTKAHTNATQMEKQLTQKKRINQI